MSKYEFIEDTSEGEDDEVETIIRMRPVTQGEAAEDDHDVSRFQDEGGQGWNC